MGDMTVAGVAEQVGRLFVKIFAVLALGAIAVTWLLFHAADVRQRTLVEVVVGASLCGTHFFVLSYGDGHTEIYQPPVPPTDEALERLRKGDITLLALECTPQLQRQEGARGDDPGTTAETDRREHKPRRNS